MITLITAVPGSGKTLYAIELIDKFNKEKRLVFQNIEGLKKELFDFPDLIHDAPTDWRDTPHGSVVIYDECQQPHLYPATAKKGLVEDERLTAMEVHRHSGHDLIFITQAPTFVHHHIRKLVGLHIHLYRARGLQKASRYEWSHVCDSPNDRGEQARADFKFWNFPKKYYSFYKSATVHTHKFSMPNKLKLLFIFLFISIFMIYQRAQNSEFLSSSDEEKSAKIKSIQEEINPEAIEYKETPTNEIVFKEVIEFTQVSGCVLNKKDKRCACYNHKGNVLDMTYKQCVLVAKSNLSKSIMKSDKTP